MKKLLIISSVIIFAILINACGGAQNSIINIQWQWNNLTLGVARVFMDNPEDFVLVFNQDGTFDAKVDCEQISGTYEMTESELNLTLGPTSEVECGGPNSLHDSFIGYLKLFESYNLDDSGLTITLSDGSTELGFKDGGIAD